MCTSIIYRRVGGGEGAAWSDAIECESKYVSGMGILLAARPQRKRTRLHLVSDFKLWVRTQSYTMRDKEI